MDAPVRLCLALAAAGRQVLRPAEPTELYDEADETLLHASAKERTAQVISMFQPHGDVLELGCGYGGTLAALAENGTSAVGVDPDTNRVEDAKRRGLHATVGRAEALPFPEGSFDVVLSVAVLEHITDIQTALDESYRVLRPGGRFCAVWGPAWLTYNGPHLIKCLPIPWVHLLFPDRVIVSALRVQLERGDWPSTYMKYKLHDFQQMGRLTRRKLRRAARQAGFSILEESSWSRPGKQELSRLPLLSEVLAGELRVVLMKPRSPSL
jgi:SAM-dependent methyltransferase